MYNLIPGEENKTHILPVGSTIYATELGYKDVPYPIKYPDETLEEVEIQYVTTRTSYLYPKLKPFRLVNEKVYLGEPGPNIFWLEVE